MGQHDGLRDQDGAVGTVIAEGRVGHRTGGDGHQRVRKSQDGSLKCCVHPERTRIQKVKKQNQGDADQRMADERLQDAHVTACSSTTTETPYDTIDDDISRTCRRNATSRPSTVSAKARSQFDERMKSTEFHRLSAGAPDSLNHGRETARKA
ncbi:MAG: hypothetical protein QM742_05710 [Aquabacterium sp.]